jgi:hypothetical protein
MMRTRVLYLCLSLFLHLSLSLSLSLFSFLSLSLSHTQTHTHTHTHCLFLSFSLRLFLCLPPSISLFVSYTHTHTRCHFQAHFHLLLSSSTPPFLITPSFFHYPFLSPPPFSPLTTYHSLLLAVEFAGCKPMKTTKVSVQGKSNLTVNFEEELWIPVWYGIIPFPFFALFPILFLFCIFFFIISPLFFLYLTIPFSPFFLHRPPLHSCLHHIILTPLHSFLHHLTLQGALYV